jgi:hypothetical protein
LLNSNLYNSQVLHVYDSPGETEHSPTVVGVEVQTAPLASEPWVRLYGVIDGGFEVMPAAWPKLEHVFSIRRSDEVVQGDGSPEPSHLLKEPHRLPNTLLTDFPVDLYLDECSPRVRG